MSALEFGFAGDEATEAELQNLLQGVKASGEVGQAASLQEAIAATADNAAPKSGAVTSGSACPGICLTGFKAVN